MKGIVRELNDGQLEVKLDEGNQVLRLKPDCAVRVLNLAGAKVRISNDGKTLRVEGKVPESGEALRWSYQVAMDKGCRGEDHTSLANLISYSRVELNGAL